MQVPRHSAGHVLVALIVLLAGCGGSGGDGTPSPAAETDDDGLFGEPGESPGAGTQQPGQSGTSTPEAGTVPPAQAGTPTASPTNVPAPAGTPTPTPAPSPGTPGQSGTATSLPTATHAATASPTPTATPRCPTPATTPGPNITPVAGCPVANGSGPPTLGELLVSPQSYQFNFVVEGEAPFNPENQDITVSGRLDRDQNVVQQVVGQPGTHYIVDGTVYVVAQGRCVVPDTNPPTFDRVRSAHEVGNMSLGLIGKTTYEGEPAYVYQLEVYGVFTGPIKLWVHAESGYPLRFESAFTHAEYWSWGDVEPVEAPC